MKIRALRDFNLGSLIKDYQAGDVFTLSDGDAKDLISAGLAEDAGDAPEAEKPKPGANRQTKPAKGPTETKPEAVVLTHASIGVPTSDNAETK